MCGEQNGEIAAFMDIEGSPPRVRGTGSCNIAQTQEAGITPACAGNSGFLTMQDCLSQDHPRVCGEQTNHCK